MTRKFWMAALFLSGCVLPQDIETGISACPATGLVGLSFYKGPPESGVLLAPEIQDGLSHWRFGNHSGNIYAVCGYDDGDDILQKLPSNLSSCQAARTPAGISGIRCKGSI